VFTVKTSVRTSWDSRAILGPAERAERKIMMGFGGYAQKVAKRSIVRGVGKDVSMPGDVPFGHGNEIYKNFIFFAYDARDHLVVIGAALVTGTRGGGDAPPEKIEYGGDELVTFVVRGKTVVKLIHYDARPAMRLAFHKAIDKFLPELIENSIVSGV
jgi:hypothetical protein